MQCACGGQINVTHSYTAGSQARTRAGRCEKCAKRYTMIVVLLSDEATEASSWGNGAYALAKRIKKGTVDIGKLLTGE